MSTQTKTLLYLLLSPNLFEKNSVLEASTTTMSLMARNDVKYLLFTGIQLITLTITDFVGVPYSSRPHMTSMIDSKGLSQ